MWNSTTAEDLKRLEEERIDQQAKVAEVVKNIIVKSDGASCEHPYLKRKKVGAHGLRQLGSALIVPLQDISGEVLNIQRIFADGSKRFQRGGRVKGLFAVIGDAGNSPTWYVSEGWATAATIFEAGGYASFAAMNAGNLMTVCIRLSEIAPAGTKIVVVADNDHQTEGNPGLTKAIQAAKAIGAEFVCPPLPCGWDDCACTDFNDYVHCVKREGLK
jgi:putative DNA primase/helicase